MTKKVRILQVCRVTHSWGMDLFKEISRAFADNKYEVTTVFLSYKPGYESYKGYYEYHGDVQFWGINRRRFDFRFIAIWKLVDLFRENDFDVVISHHYRPMLLVDIANRFCGIPKLYSVFHDIGKLRDPRRKFFVKGFLSKHTKFVPVSDGVKQDLLSANAGLSENRIVTIHNAIDIEAVIEQQLPGNEARAKLGIPDSCFVFGNIARLVPRKGHKFLIKAFAQIARGQKNTRLAIIGLGALESELIRTAKQEGIGDQVIVETSLASNAIRYIKAFDVFVLPSTEEGLPIVLLEAMSAHLPLIATPVGGVAEAVGGVGVLVPPRDIGALAQALRKVLQLTDEERNQLGVRSYSRLRENFSIEKYQKAFQQLVEI